MVSLFSSGKLSSIGAKATTILSILAAASANFDARHRKTQSREIPKPKSQGNSKAQKEEGILTADYAEGSDKEEL
jgi:hypothetical protein